MPTLKVKPLEWYMQEDAEGLAEQGYTQTHDTFPLIGRDGYYCCDDNVWFEVDGKGYDAYPRTCRAKAREYFCYSLTHNDEAILTSREENAMREVLKITRDAAVRRVITKRLQLHTESLSLRETVRQAMKVRLRVLGK